MCTIKIITLTGFPLKTENTIFHDFSMIIQWYQVFFPGNKIVLTSVLAACVIYLNCFHLPKLFLYVNRFGHIYMQPPVVKYQAIRKEHLCKE